VAEYYLDHDVARDIGRQLTARGHPARTAHELGLERGRDDEHLLLAAQQRWILVTHNRKDFTLLHAAWRRWFVAYGVVPLPEHAGILVIRQKVWLADEAAVEISRFVQSGVVLANELYEWTPSRGWVRGLRTAEG
jgi:hypothetical protein